MKRVPPKMYRAFRRLNVIDVTRLMHMTAADSEGQSSSDSNPPDGYTLRSIGIEDLERAVRNDLAPQQIGKAEALRAGDRACLVAEAEPRIAAFLWIATGSVAAEDNYSRSPHLGTSLDLPPATGFVFNAWTAPPHRGRRLVASLIRFAFRHRVLGIEQLLTTMDWTNEASRRAFQRVGMRDLGLIWRCGVGTLQISRVPETTKILGLRLAENAPGIVLRQSGEA